nr:hypothetical protein [Tanacetum cinerariifolium]
MDNCHPWVPRDITKNMANEEDHALVADGETPIEFALMANIETRRSEKVKEGVGYNAVPLHRSSGPRPHRDSMRPTFRPAGHRPHGPSMNPWRPIMNGARPYKSFFQAPSNETRPFLKSSAV